VLVQVKNKCERSLPVRPPGVEKTSRLGSRDPVANGVKCGPHGGKNSKMKLWEVPVIWTSLGPLPRWVPGPTTRWALGTTRLVPHGT
jgi:hypothetical protein